MSEIKYKKDLTVPILPLDEVLELMQDDDYVTRMAAKGYYERYYLHVNSLHNDRPSE